MACSGFVRLFSRSAAAVAVVMLAACTTTGQSFNTQALGNFIPGHTTFAEAVTMLGAEPVNTYSQLNGAMLARWAHKGSVLTDSIYFRQEATLRFDPEGRFVGVVDTVNILIPPRDQNSPASVHAAQQQASAPVQQPPVQEVERIIIIDAAGIPQPAAVRAQPTAVQSTTAQPTTAQQPSPPQAGTPIMATPLPTPSPISAPPRSSNTLEQSRPNPAVTYPVPSGRQ